MQDRDISELSVDWAGCLFIHDIILNSDNPLLVRGSWLWMHLVVKKNIS